MNEPRIAHFNETHLVGMRTHMTLGENKTGELWQSFMPRLSEIDRVPDSGLFSVQIYPEGFSMNSGSVPFEKWAAAPVNNANLPEGMEELIIPSGLYAVFLHHGPANTFHNTLQFIFGRWLPSSTYMLDQRPQFEIMPPGYKGPAHPDSEEEVWIPIKPK
ncbi:GyrI-like domain-containing protein [Fulvivirga sedimenti]|uniref:GyrI-like domain-containing protein n=1 Tax=Fulvivirga sedimenti TaxID=2879465 RepID=A0A9X1HZ48_9BACT|nr:GyrI-like domain-containing protein [Fulvivirga sedimenti]MCA6079109.1 GyrI-like domain-containing protein [Fulvivirga sedimenti]